MHNNITELLHALDGYSARKHFQAIASLFTPEHSELLIKQTGVFLESYNDSRYTIMIPLVEWDEDRWTQDFLGSFAVRVAVDEAMLDYAYSTAGDAVNRIFIASAYLAIICTGRLDHGATRGAVRVAAESSLLLTREIQYNVIQMLIHSTFASGEYDLWEEDRSYAIYYAAVVWHNILRLLKISFPTLIAFKDTGISINSTWLPLHIGDGTDVVHWDNWIEHLPTLFGSLSFIAEVIRRVDSCSGEEEPGAASP